MGGKRKFAALQRKLDRIDIADLDLTDTHIFPVERFSGEPALVLRDQL